MSQQHQKNKHDDELVIEQDVETLACMEVRGGNQAINASFVTPGLEIHIVSMPFRPTQDHDVAAGGDVHYISACGEGRITRLLVADVAGHGDAVASIATTLHQIMRRYINHIDAKKLARVMNDRFSAVSNPGRFATAIVGTYFAPTGELTLVNAGHPPPVVFRAATGKWLSSLDAIDRDEVGNGDITNLPLGIVDGTGYSLVPLELGVGDALLIYTDALSESQNAAGEVLTEERLCKLLPAIGKGQTLSQWSKQVVDLVRRAHPRNLVSDDTTLVICRATSGATKATFVGRMGGLKRFCVNAVTGKGISWPEMSVRNIVGGIFPRMSRFGSKKNSKTKIGRP